MVTQQECIRAQLVAAEHCGGFEKDFAELDNDLFAVIPRDFRERLDDLGDEPLSATEFERIACRTEELAEQMATICSMAGIDRGEMDALRECVRNTGETFVGARIDGQLTDRTLEEIERAY